MILHALTCGTFEGTMLTHVLSKTLNKNIANLVGKEAEYLDPENKLI